LKANGGEDPNALLGGGFCRPSVGWATLQHHRSIICVFGFWLIVGTPALRFEMEREEWLGKTL